MLILKASTPSPDLLGPGFGNILVRGRGLQELTLPELPSYRPQTAGWWVLLGGLLIVITILMYKQYRRWQANRYRRLALKQLNEIAQFAKGIRDV